MLQAMALHRVFKDCFLAFNRNVVDTYIGLRAGTYRVNPVIQSDVFGCAELPIDLASRPWITPDSTWYFQFWFRDPAGPGGTGFNLTDALGVTFCR